LAPSLLLKTLFGSGFSQMLLDLEPDVPPAAEITASLAKNWEKKKREKTFSIVGAKLLFLL
jgi:hypothetical protein